VQYDNKTSIRKRIFSLKKGNKKRGFKELKKRNLSQFPFALKRGSKKIEKMR